MRYANPLIPSAHVLDMGCTVSLGRACGLEGRDGQPVTNQRHTGYMVILSLAMEMSPRTYQLDAAVQGSGFTYEQQSALSFTPAGAFSYEDSAGGSRARHHTRARRPLRIQQGHSTKLPPHRACSFGTGLRQVNWFR